MIIIHIHKIIYYSFNVIYLIIDLYIWIFYHFNNFFNLNIFHDLDNINLISCIGLAIRYF